MPSSGKQFRGSNRQAQNGRPRKKAFKSSRLAELETERDDISSESNIESGQDEPIEDSEDITEDEEIPVNTVSSYHILLQSLNTQKRPTRSKRKRRISEPAIDIPIEDGNAVRDNDIGKDDQDEAVEEENSQNEPPEEAFDSGMEEADTAQTDIDIDDQTLDRLIADTKNGSISAIKLPFYEGWKAILSRSSILPPNQRISQHTTRNTWNHYKIKDKLRRQVEQQFPHDLTGLMASLSEPVLSHQDTLFCGRTSTNTIEIKQLVCVHILDYMMKNRDHILKNTTKIAKSEDGHSLEYRDQGFTRPKVLFLLPTRQACYSIMGYIVSLFQPEQTENRKRFDETFTQKQEDDMEDKPDDFRELFQGNDDDLFRVGIKFTRKTLKYFSPFYTSDIILASPLGLRMAFTKKGSTKEDFDFLSSIEIVVVDQAEALLQQNWEHVEYVFQHLNLQPKEDHGCDFSRLRSWYLDGNSKFLRQTIVLSSFLTPELNQLYSQHMLNIKGRVKIMPETYDGAIVNLGIAVKQTFVRFDAAAPAQEPDARFKMFTTALVPNLNKLVRPGTQGPHGILIYIQSYMDFVRVRNFMANSSTAHDISFGAISEYTPSSDVARARSHFVSGRHAVLLYSGRAHHFKRYKLKGVKKVIMYSLPDNPLFYTEVAGGYLARSLSEGHVLPEDASVRALFCKWDVLRLERIIGTKRVASMLWEKGRDVFDFV